jgi:hypothetical protein
MKTTKQQLEEFLQSEISPELAKKVVVDICVTVIEDSVNDDYDDDDAWVFYEYVGKLLSKNFDLGGAKNLIKELESEKERKKKVKEVSDQIQRLQIELDALTANDIGESRP